MRGRKPLKDVCRVCDVPINRDQKKLSNERLCLRCKADKQIITNWSKKPILQIQEKIKNAEHAIIILNKALKKAQED